MSLKEVKDVKGRVKIVIRDAKTGEVIKVIEKDNIVTDVGRAFAAEAFAGYPGRINLGWYMDIGTGVCDPTAQDQDLCSPIIESTTRDSTTYYFRRWVKGVDITLQGNTVMFHARWMPEDANNYSICEEILFVANPNNVGNLGNQQMWTSPDPLKNITKTIGARVTQHASFSCVSKTSSILLDIYVTITFT
jgi:hypothetical protein